MTTPDQKAPEQKLYAGKFATVEELEAGYKNSLPVFQENETLKKKFDDVTKVPEEYQTPADVSFEDSALVELKKVAKSTGLNQSQYEKLARETYSRGKMTADEYENAKKSIGADNLNLMQDFVKKQYGEKIGNALVEKAITNKEIREEIMAERNKVLNSGVPGMRGAAYSHHQVTKKDILAAREDMDKVRGKAQIEARSKYINLQRQYAAQEKQA